MVCIQKTDIPTTLADYRPNTLLHTDYKIVARIIANRLRPTLSDMLHLNQYCGVPENTIFDAVTTARNVIVYAELAHAPPSILSLDFTTAFDRISHTYLLRMLKSYGYSMIFITLTQGMYDTVLSLVQTNGYVAGSFPIQYSVRQGSPISMLLFALVLNLLICLLERNLIGIRIGHRTTKTAAVAYGDGHDFCDGTSRHSNNPTDIRKGNRCLFEYPKTKSSRIVEYIYKHDGHLILSGNNHTGF